MPTSTSSKTSVGTFATSLVTTSMASASRDNSPPDATFAIGPSGCFGWLATRNSICSIPWLVGVASGISAASKRPPFIASACIAFVTLVSSSEAANRRFLPSSSASRFPVRLGVGGGARQQRRVGASRERGELRLGVVAQRWQCVGPDAILARDVVERREPRLDARELRRIDVELREIAAQLARRLVELDPRGLDQRDDFAQRGVVRGGCLQLRGERSEPPRERAVAFADFVFRGARRLGQRRGMRETRLHLRHRRPFVGADAERGELLQSRRERFAERDAGRVGLGRRVARLDRRTPLAPRVRARAGQRREAPEGVQQRALRVGARQRLVRVLPVEIDQHLADGFLLRERGGTAVDPRAALPLRIQHPAQQQRVLIVVAREPFVREPRRDLVAAADVEHRGELGARSTRAQLPRFEAVAQQEAQRVEQDRLAGARLAGEHREPARELEVERLDDDEIADGEETKHAMRKAMAIDVGAKSGNVADAGSLVRAPPGRLAGTPPRSPFQSPRPGKAVSCSRSGVSLQ